jgi:hypothetical protein
VNTILHLTAKEEMERASIFAYDTLDQAALGGSLLVLFFGFIVMTIAAFDDDLYLITGKQIFGFRPGQREGITLTSKLALGVSIAMLFIATLEYALR